MLILATDGDGTGMESESVPAITITKARMDEVRQCADG